MATDFGGIEMALFRQKQQQEPQVIDLTEPEPVPLEFGYPTPCPACGENGYLDSVNNYRGVQYQHCPSCFTKWSTTEAELAHR
jgi:formate dehydrogenase maturation protein FdhE